MAPDPFQAARTPARRTLGDVTLTDLLLALIVGLGATRLAGVVAILLVAGPGAAADGDLPDMQLLVVVS